MKDFGNVLSKVGKETRAGMLTPGVKYKLVPCFVLVAAIAVLVVAGQFAAAQRLH